MRVFFAIFVALGLVSTARAAEPGASPVTIGPDVEAVRTLIEQARKADIAADRSLYGRTLTDGFSLGTSTGERESPQSKLAYLRSDRHKVNSEAICDLRVRVHGTAAIAMAIMTQTWVKEASGWKLAATHGSRREDREAGP